MPEIGTSGLMSGVGKQGGAQRQYLRPTSTLPANRSKETLTGQRACPTSPRDSRQRAPELGKAHRCRFRVLDDAWAIRAQRRDGERHGDAVISEAIELTRAKLLAAGNHHAIGPFLRLYAEPPQILHNRAN